MRLRNIRVTVRNLRAFWKFRGFWMHVFVGHSEVANGMHVFVGYGEIANG